MQVSAQEKTQVPAGVLRHIVMVKFKETTTAAQIKDLENKFGALEEKVDTITDYEWGLAATVEEGLDQGFTHCFVVTFANQAGLEVYLPHEAHLAFVKVFKPQIDKLLVLDYVAKYPGSSLPLVIRLPPERLASLHKPPSAIEISCRWHPSRFGLGSSRYENTSTFRASGLLSLW